MGEGRTGSVLVTPSKQSDVIKPTSLFNIFGKSSVKEEPKSPLPLHPKEEPESPMVVPKLEPKSPLPLPEVLEEAVEDGVIHDVPKVTSEMSEDVIGILLLLDY